MGLDGDEASERRRALAIVWGALSRRDHTVAEVRRLLERREVTPDAAEAAVAEVAGAGYLDDGEFARRLAEDRRRLDGWGADRIERELLRRGVDPETIEAMLGGRGPVPELEAACALLARRVSEPLEDDRARARALGILARRGYDSEVAHEAVRRHERERAAGAEAGG